MAGRLAAVVVLTGVLGVASAAEVRPVAQSRAKPAFTPPPGIKVVKGMKFKKITPRKPASMVAMPWRLPFDCYYTWTPPDSIGAGKVIMYFRYMGKEPVQTAKLSVHWEIEYCCSGTVGGDTSNLLLYPDSAFDVFGLPPDNFNKPPQGQPVPACSAYGWLED